MGLLLLSIGTVLLLVFIVFFIKGQKYEYMLESLDDDAFPIKMIYCAGLALQDLKLFSLQGQIGQYLRTNCRLLYSRRFGEFYARIVWAQALSFSLLCGGVLLVLAPIVPDMTNLLGLLGVVMTFLPGGFFVWHVGELVGDRRNACEAEFPNAISKMALIVNSGVILHDAWEIVATGNEGEFYTLMQKSCEEMKNGKSDIDAIYEFGVVSGSDDIKKFTSALIQSIERGGGELPSFLSNQSKELWSHRRQVMLQKGEQAASALLMPIALMFVGVMLIVMAAAMQSFTM